MSVTISIENNCEYVKANCPERIRTYSYDKDIDPEQHVFEDYPFEMNLANGNFAALWNSLGLDCEDCSGSIRAIELKNRLKMFSAKKLTCETEVQGNFYDFGRSTEQVTGYYWRLQQICVEALRRGAETLIVYA